ncbi:hypothetical protein Q31a_59140 [Aureliella helgolandensis]|uniref:Uncharacterized protein n=1 Tax=Aureliella helgolandensis TaxID=2527968 RepID=A0A518GG00_9BACT|nr:hypothetical protein Q31a_59140 [Aureliella helgolandensis]
MFPEFYALHSWVQRVGVPGTLSSVPDFIARPQECDPGKAQKIEDFSKLGQVR